MGPPPLSGLRLLAVLVTETVTCSRTLTHRHRLCRVLLTVTDRASAVPSDPAALFAGGVAYQPWAFDERGQLLRGQPLGRAEARQIPVVVLPRAGKGGCTQALSGDWVSNAHTGQNGVVGFVLGAVEPYWGSSESPAGGNVVSITTNLVPLALIAGGPSGPLYLHTIELRSVIPADFAD
jgi:hypothetical protein